MAHKIRCFLSDVLIWMIWLNSLGFTEFAEEYIALLVAVTLTVLGPKICELNQMKTHLSVPDQICHLTQWPPTTLTVDMR